MSMETTRQRVVRRIWSPVGACGVLFIKIGLVHTQGHHSRIVGLECSTDK